MEFIVSFKWVSLRLEWDYQLWIFYFGLFMYKFIHLYILYFSVYYPHLYINCTPTLTLLNRRRKKSMPKFRKTGTLSCFLFLFCSRVDWIVYWWAEKFVGWLWCNGRIWPNVFYFSLWSTHFFHRCCSAWIPVIEALILILEKVLNFRYDLGPILLPSQVFFFMLGNRK